MTLPLADNLPEPWATEWGEDRFGVFMSFAVGEVEHRLRWVPGGTFVMGSPETEAGRWESEGPAHEVTLSEGYWLGETPVTQALWHAVMGENPSRFQSAERPVEQVSWQDCQRFLATLNRMVPLLDARLPTEAEWERACRAGTNTATWQGDLEIVGESNAPLLDPIAWYRGNSGQEFELEEGHDSSAWPEKQYAHTRAGTRAVRGKRPNPYGLFDMLGNVCEWCADWYGVYDAAPVTDPLGPGVGSYRVYRGGGWSSFAGFVRAAGRNARPSRIRYDVLGFRLARGQSGGARGAEPRPRSDLPLDAGLTEEIETHMYLDASGRVLVFLHRLGRDCGEVRITQDKLAQGLGLGLATTQQALRDLEVYGAIKRRVDPEDRRRRIIKLIDRIPRNVRDILRQAQHSRAEPPAHHAGRGRRRSGPR